MTCPFWPLDWIEPLASGRCWVVGSVRVYASAPTRLMWVQAWI
jgi:hypothetical protein